MVSAQMVSDYCMLLRRKKREKSVTVTVTILRKISLHTKVVVPLNGTMSSNRTAVAVTAGQPSSNSLCQDTDQKDHEIK